MQSVVSQIRTIYGETSVPGDKWLSRDWTQQCSGAVTRIRIIVERRVGQLDTGDIAIMSGRGDVKCAVRCEDTKIDRKQNQVQHSTRRHHSLLCRARLVSPGSSGSSQCNAEFSSLHSARVQAPGPVQAVSSQCSALADPVSWCLTISH